LIKDIKKEKYEPRFSIEKDTITISDKSVRVWR